MNSLLNHSMTYSQKLGLSLAECELLTSLSRASLYRAMAAGELRAVNCGRRRIVLREDLESFMKCLVADREDMPQWA